MLIANIIYKFYWISNGNFREFTCSDCVSTAPTLMIPSNAVANFSYSGTRFLQCGHPGAFYQGISLKIKGGGEITIEFNDPRMFAFDYKVVEIGRSQLNNFGGGGIKRLRVYQDDAKEEVK